MKPQRQTSKRQHEFTVYGFAKHLGVPDHEIRLLIKNGVIEAEQQFSPLTQCNQTSIPSDMLPVAAEALRRKYNQKGRKLPPSLLEQMPDALEILRETL